MHILLSLIIASLFGPAQPAETKPLDAYIFIAEECPISIYMASDLRKLYADYGEQCHFHLVFPVHKSSRTTAEAFANQHELTGMEIIMDKEQNIVEKYEAVVTPEIVIVDANSAEVKYQGRINDAFFAPGKKRHSRIQRDADQAFRRLTHEKSVPKPWPDAIGCIITAHE